MKYIGPEFVAVDGGVYQLFQYQSPGGSESLGMLHRPGDRIQRRRAAKSAALFAAVGYVLSTAYFYWEGKTQSGYGGYRPTDDMGVPCFAPCFFAPLSALVAYVVARLIPPPKPEVRFGLCEALVVNDVVMGVLNTVEANAVDATVELCTAEQMVRLELLVARDAVDLADLVKQERSRLSCQEEREEGHGQRLEPMDPFGPKRPMSF